MKDTKKLREFTDRILAEAPKKKGKKGKKDAEAAQGHVRPREYGYAEAFDFARPLGFLNPTADYVNWGPFTGGGADAGPIRDLKHGVGKEQSSLQSTWERLSEAVDPKGTWQLAEAIYDEAKGEKGGDVHIDVIEPGAEHDMFGTKEENASCEDMDEVHLGFKKLSGDLAHQKGVKDPDALAASIGRKKYGAAGMAAKSAAGRK